MADYTDMDLESLSDAELMAIANGDSAGDMDADLESLSDEELAAIAGGGESIDPRAEREKTTLGQIENDVRDIPSALMGMVKAIPSGVRNLANAPKDAVQLAKYAVKAGAGDLIGRDLFANDSDYEKLKTLEAADRLERTLKGTGKMAMATAGSVTPAGPVAGGAGGVAMWDQLMQALGVDPMTTGEEALRNLQRDVTQGGVVSAAAKAPAAAKAGTRATVDAAARVAEPVLDKVTPQLAQELREARVAKELLKLDPGLPAKLAGADAPTSTLGKMETSAERTGSAELATLQDTAASGPMAPQMAQRAQELAETRANELLKVSKQGESLKSIVGDELRGSAEGKNQALREKATEAYDKVRKSKEEISIYPEKEAIANYFAKLSKVDREALLEEPGFKALVEKVVAVKSGNRPNYSTIADLEALKKQAYRGAKKAGRAGDDFLAEAYNNIGELLKDAPYRAADEGLVSPRLTSQLTKAKGIAQERITTYKQGIGGKILKKEGPDRYKVASENVVDLIFKKERELGEFLKFASKSDKAKLRDEIGVGIRQKFEKSPARAIDYVRTHRKKIEQLYKERPNALKAIDDLIGSIKKESDTVKLGKAGSQGNSTTAQRVYQQKLIDRLFPKPEGSWVDIMSSAKGAGLGYLFSGGNPLTAAAVSLLAPKMESLLYGGVRAKKGATSSKALLSPEYLEQIIGKAVKDAAPTKFDNAMSGVERYALTAGVLAESDEEMAFDMAQPESAPSKKKVSEPAMPKDVKAVEAEIDADPYYSTTYEIESGRDPKAKNPESSASGGFQFIKATAKALGVNDPFDLEQSFQGMKKLTEEHARKFKTNDPVALYSLHYLGEDVYRRWQAGKPLNKDERAQVVHLNEKVLPKFKQVYASKVELV